MGGVGGKDLSNQSGTFTSELNYESAILLTSPANGDDECSNADRGEEGIARTKYFKFRESDQTGLAATCCLIPSQWSSLGLYIGVMVSGPP